jgi:hypothetical protein
MIKKINRLLDFVLVIALLLPWSLFLNLLPAQTAYAATIPIINEGFNNVSSNGTPAPAGWTFSGITSTYTGSGNYGLSSPALKFDATGDSVTTPIFSSANSLSFWVREYSPDTISSLAISGFVSGVWINLETLKPIPNSVGTTENLALPFGTTQLKFIYTKSTSDLAFDDVSISDNDSVAPVIEPHDNITAEATSASGAIVNYVSPLATDNVDVTASAICSPASGSLFPIGITTVTCNKTDFAGNVATPTTFNVIVQDATAPQGTVAINDGAAYTNSSNVNLTLSATDAVGVTQMCLSNSDSSCNNWVSYAASAPWILNSDQGNESVYAYFKDAAGNASDQASANILLDTVAPTTVDNSVSSWYNYDPTINLTCTDSGFGCDQTYYSLNSGGTWQAYDSTKGIQFNTDGIYTLEYYSTDLAGNQELIETAANQIQIDTVAPTDPGALTTLSNPTNQLTQNWNWTASTDATSGLAGYYYSVNGGTQTFIGDSTHLMTSLAQGDYQFAVQAVDNAGNLSNQVSQDLIVDTTAPVITINGTSPVNVEVYNPYIDAGATALDNYFGDLTSSIMPVSNVNVDQLGNYTVKYDVSDPAGNAATEVVRQINVVDTNAPVIAAHADVNAVATSSSGAIVNYDNPIATDNFDAPTSAICDPASGSLFPIGITKVTCNITDSSGNVATPTNFNVIVSDLPAPVISSQTSGQATASSAVITWTTDHAATSRVIYDTVSHPILGAAPKYGYAFSTVEDATPTFNHSVTISDLTPGTTYYYRVVSHGSPETVSVEKSFTTSSLLSTTKSLSSLTTQLLSTAVQVVAAQTLLSNQNSSVSPTVNNPTVPNNQAANSIAPAVKAASTTNNKIDYWVWIIILAILVLGVGGYFWYRRKNAEQL